MRSTLMLRPTLALCCALLLAACAGTATRPEPAAPAAAALTAPHDNLHATLWMQTSAEYAAAVRGGFHQARRMLDAALADPAWDALPREERALASGFEALPPAVIVDADETMIDNSPFQARGVRDDTVYTRELWLGWSLERRARAIPGAVEFARYAEQHGVAVYFVTNRMHDGEVDSTADNLRALGFPVAEDRANLLLSGDPRAPAHEKRERRQWVGARHRVLLMLGDNLGDFVDGHDGSRAARNRVAAAYADWWGERWIMLPNPAYGHWVSALLQDCDPALRERDPRACLHAGLRMD